MNQIIAKKLVLIQKNPGIRTDYTHILDIGFFREKGQEYMVVRGESLDSFDMPRPVYDKYKIDDLELMLVEFYIPKV
jgi:hypothetical protein